jgi:hypothetical protein
MKKMIFVKNKVFILRPSLQEYLKWFENLQLGSRSRRDEGLNRRNISNILRIENLVPTKRLDLRGGFQTILGFG